MGASRAIGRRSGGLVVSGLVVVGLLTGCEQAAEKITGPDPEPAAQALAAALGSGDFTGVTFVDTDPATVTEAYADVVGSMGEVAPEVGLLDLAESDGAATATLAWNWPLGAQEWSYQAEATLREVDGDFSVAWSPAMVEPSLSGEETLDLSSLGAARADVRGAGGIALVTDRPVVRFGIDRSQVPAKKAGASARRLAGLLDIDPAPYVKRVEGAGDKAFVEALVYRRDDVPQSVAAGYGAIKGAIAVPDQQPLAPTREFAAPILGTVGEVTAEMIEKHPDLYSVGDRAGLSGLQARYDEQLRGTPGLVVNAIGGEEDRELFREKAVDGTPLKLTLDHDLQQVAERLLADVGPASALVAIRPSNGDILVAANGPGNDGYNMATFGQFAPGSTFKSVSTLALLRDGLRPDSPVECPRTITVNGKQFENYDDYPPGGLGRIPLRTALANSCNTAFIGQADRLSDDALVDAAGSLGMGIDHDLGFPAYFGGVVPPEGETEKAADLIGQGTILASPMVMATVIASIQGGELVVPRLVKGVEATAPDEATPLSAGEARTLRTLLRGVVTNGSGRFLTDVPGGPVIAKTGTAEFSVDGKLETHAWMIAAHDDLAVAVFVDRGDSGSGTAGPILEAFLRAPRR